jgi:CBS domain-containing protein
VTDGSGALLGTITDGDLRRAILAGLSTDHTLRDLLAGKKSPAGPQPVTAPADTGPEVLCRLMQEHGVRQIPLLDPDGRVTDLATLDELVPAQWPAAQAVIMAGGFGTRP